MKVLHTSDWHLGGLLHERKRYEEHEKFLNWLIQLLRNEDIDVLLVAGDIFDTVTPSNRAQELYYQFLYMASSIPGLQVVITAGNHDSPSLLNAPKGLLKALHIHVIGTVTDDPEDEILLLHDVHGRSSLIVCAVPYLRDRDIRLTEPGESIEEKARKMRDGVREHYRRLGELSEKKRLEIGVNLPIIAMGHLFANGCMTTGDDGVRDLYIGNLAGIEAEMIGQGFDYLALGHLHRPEAIRGNTNQRYSGSPFPMGFGEAGQKKQVVLIEFHDNNQPLVREIPVEISRELRIIEGNIQSIEEDLKKLCLADYPVMVEVIFESGLVTPLIQAKFRELVENTQVDIVKFRRKDPGEQESPNNSEITLTDLDELDVFSRCLDENAIPEEERKDLVDAYCEILASVHEEDMQAH
jgi:exonuclease SbcD